MTRVYPEMARGRGPGELPAVDVQDLAGDEGRGFQEQDAVHDVADMAHAAERRKQAAEPMTVALRQPEEPGDADSHHGGVIGGGVGFAKEEHQAHHCIVIERDVAVIGFGRGRIKLWPAAGGILGF